MIFLARGDAGNGLACDLITKSTRSTKVHQDLFARLRARFFFVLFVLFVVNHFFFETLR